MKTLLIFFIAISAIFPQTLYLEENFDYPAGDNLTSHGWTAHSAGGSNPIKVSSGGLSFTGYTGSGVGNAALVNNNGEDVNRSLGSTISSGTIYYSFLVKVDGVANGYFIHLIKNASTFAARVYIQSATGGFNFGLSNSNTGVFGSTVFSTGTTYLCIVKYDVSVTGNCSLWVKSVGDGVPSDEASAGTPEVTASGSGQTDIVAIALRQYNASQNITVDGIRVADSWAQAPLPVELTSFTASLLNNKVKLNWSTATESQNFGWDIERASINSESNLMSVWEKVGFISGAGNSNSPKQYFFIDNSALYGMYAYRLRQIDNNGTTSLSNELKIFVGHQPQVYDIKTFPNPMNPASKIRYAIPQDGFVNISVYDITGKLVRTLVNEDKQSGVYEISFDGGNLASGLYLAVLRANEMTITQKIQLIK